MNKSDEKNDPSSSFQQESDEIDKDSSEDTLIIDCSTPKTTKKRKRRRKSESPPELNDSRLERTINETMKKFKNMTAETAKKMLMKLVKNEHVLALVSLQAEEEEQTSKSQNSDSENENENNDKSRTRLTRFKAKQLKKAPLPIGPLNASEPDDEVVALIRDEMKSDDEDDEYQPCDDEIQSDDDLTNTTMSDIESRPSTPGSSLTTFDKDFSSPVAPKDGIFKVPKQPLTTEEQIEQENISRRTRSKLCLTTTPIETIESTFVPPDITTDMYEFGQDNDAEWNEFLSEFMKPLDNYTEIDDDGDPEYVAAGNVPMDKEELREVRIPKKELNELISELLEMDGLVDESLIAENAHTNHLQPMTSTPHPPRKSDMSGEHSKSKRQKTHSSITNSITKLQESTHSLETPKRDYIDITASQDRTPLQTPSITPVPTPHQTPSKNSDFSPFVYSPFQTELQATPIQIPSQVQPSPSTSTFLQTPIGTPTLTTVSSTSNMSTLTSTVPSFAQQPFYIVSVPDPVPMPTTPSSTAVFVQNAQNQLELHQLPVNPGSTFNPVNFLNQAYYQNGMIQLPQYQSIVVQVPTVDLLQNKLDLSGMLAQSTVTADNTLDSVTSTTTTTEPSTTNTTIIADSSTTETANVSNIAKYRMKKMSKFAYLNNEPPPQEIVYSPDAVGFTPYQRQIFDQQIRMHTQLLTTNFLQTYAHPEYWEQAEKFKANLIELKELVTPEKSQFNSKHLHDAVDFVCKWEDGLKDTNDKNVKYVQHLRDEIQRQADYDKKNRQFIGKFHHRLMEEVINSKIFIYPNLLPKIPFRKKFKQTNRNNDIPNSELMLIAFSFERFTEILTEEMNKCNRKAKKKKPTLLKVVEYVQRYICPTRGLAGLRSMLDTLGKETMMNPIKYFCIHKKAPAMKHVIENVDLNNVLAPKDHPRDTLPYLWNKYVYSNERIRRVYYNQDSEESGENDTQIITLSDDENDLINVEIDADNVEEIQILVADGQQQSDPDNNIVTTSDLTPNPSIVEVVESEKNSYAIEIVYGEVPQINISDLTSTSILHSSPEKESHNECPEIGIIEEIPTVTNINTTKPLTSILKNSSQTKSPQRKKSVTFDLPAAENSRKLTRKRSFVVDRILTEYNFQRKFKQIIQKFESNYIQVVGFEKTKSLSVICVYNWTRTIDIYTSFLKKRIVLTKYSKSRTMSTENSDDVEILSVTPSESPQTSTSPVEGELQSVIEIKEEVIDDDQQVVEMESIVDDKSTDASNTVNSIVVDIVPKIEPESDKDDSLEKPEGPLIENVTETEKIVDPGGESTNTNINTSNPPEPSTSAETTVKSKIKKAISEEYSRRLGKKYDENFQLIISKPPENEYYLLEHDCAYAYNYFELVMRTFRENGDNELFDEFHNILKTFDPNFESVPELYHKMENLFMPKYSDLLDLFMTFLLPEHASEIGRFFEHFILTNMSTLLEKLNHYFKQQPGHIKKIYAALNECANDPDITMEKLKQKIIPLLKNNRILIDWFTQLFDKEKPMDLDPKEHEKIYYRNLLNCDNDSSSELDEILPSELIDSVVDINSEKRPPCGVKYVGGKLIVRGRIVLPAKLSFMAYNGVLDDSNVETIPDELEGYCVHEIRKHARGYLDATTARLKREKEDRSSVVEIVQEPPINIPDVQVIKTEVPDEQPCSRNNKKKIIKVVKPNLSVCDPTTQKAHAIRLNPAVYARNGEKYSDVAHLIINPIPYPASNGKHHESHHDEKTSSPRKQNPKTTSKKFNSPNISKKKSPTMSPSTNMTSHSNSPSTSKALQTSKKLKKLVQDDSNQNSRKRAKICCDSKKKSDSDAERSSSKNSAKELFPKQTENSNREDQSNIPKWTRDEDKVILEEIQKGLQRDKIPEQLKEKLKPRSVSEIVERYDFLMNFLKKMQNAK